MDFSRFSINSLIAYLNYFNLMLNSTINENSKENISRFKSDCMRELKRRSMV